MCTGVMLDMTQRTPTTNPILLQRLNESLSKNWTTVKQKYLTIYIADCAVWPLLQIANFAFVPHSLQAIYVNVLNVFWNAFLCYVSQDSH